MIPNPGGNCFNPGGFFDVLGKGINQNSMLGQMDAYNVASKAGDMSAMTDAASGVIGGAMSGITGAMKLADTIGKDFDTSKINAQVKGVNDISRGDILSQNTKINAGTKGVMDIAGDALSAAQSGMAVAGPWGALAGLVPIATGIFGNDAKQRAATAAQQQEGLNLQAKDQQFRQQDLKQNMANFSNYGGELFAYGGNIPSQLTEFNSGGTHEQNINGGIMQGTGQNGKPNLVEEGETKHENYIFSDRLKIDKATAMENKLPKSFIGKTFAEASKVANKEAKERPNDPLSNNAVKAELAKLTQAQELYKQKMEQAKQKKMAKMIQENPGLAQQMMGQMQQPQQQMQGIPQQQMPQTVQEEPQQPDVNIMAEGQGYSDGGSIHINPANRGKFNATKKRTGKSTEELTHSSNPLTRKRAIFAQNTAKWHHAYGGDLFARGGILDIDFNQNNPGLPSYVENIYGSTHDNKLAQGGDQSHYFNNVPQGYQVYASGGNMYPGTQDGTSFMDMVGNEEFKGLDSYALNRDGIIGGNPLNALSPTGSSGAKYLQAQKMAGNSIPGQKSYNSKLYDNSNNKSIQFDYARYAPVITNAMMGLSDILDKPETVKYNRYNPEQITSRMQYSPIDTQWMTSKMQSQLSANRQAALNASGGNRAQALASTLGINRGGQDALADAYMKAQEINYNRKLQADQYNMGINAQNIQGRNAAQQGNIQLAMQENDMNARNRAAQRNAARNAIMQSATSLGQIGRENFDANVARNVFGYYTDAKGNLLFDNQGNPVKKK